MDQKQFASAMAQIAEEKGIPQEEIIKTIEMAIAAAYKKDYGQKGQNIRVEFNPETGKVKIFQVFLIVDESMLKPEEEEEEGEDEETKKAEEAEKPEEIKEAEVGGEEAEEEEEKKIRFNPKKHMMIEEAKKIKKSIKPGGELEIELKAPEGYGRIAAQTAKQVIIQRLREAEREAVYGEYKDKEGEVVSGIVQRIEGRNMFLDIGRATGIMFPDEQIPGEHYRMGQRLRVYITKVERGTRGANIILSRSHPKLVSKLFEIEVPEVAAGTVEIKSIAREPGSRSKIAVYTEEEGVDPVGSCVGQRGTRVQAVINELGGEKIDIIEWDKKMDKFIANALSPAKILDIEIDEKKREAVAIVPEDQLSLAIGQKGQNVRLAAKLTGWRIDIKSQAMIKEEKKKKKVAKKKAVVKKKMGKKPISATPSVKTSEVKKATVGKKVEKTKEKKPTKPSKGEKVKKIKKVEKKKIKKG